MNKEYIQNKEKLKCADCGKQIYDEKSYNPTLCRVKYRFHYSGCIFNFPIARFCGVYKDNVAVTLMSGGGYLELKHNRIFCCECGIKRERNC